MVQVVPQSLPAASPAAAAPPIDPQAFLQAFLDSKLSLAALAEKLALSPLKLAEAAAHPAIHPHLRALEDLALIRLRIAAADARIVAIQALRTNLDVPTLDPTERRRAAALLLRNLTKPLDTSAQSAPTGADADDAVPPRARPSRSMQPGDVAYDVLDALRDNERPTPDSGLATLHAFLDPEASIGLDDHELGLLPAEDFLADPPEDVEPLLRAGRLEFHYQEHLKNDSSRVFQPVTVHPRRSLPTTAGAAPESPPPPITYFIELRRQFHGRHADCWLIRSILTHAQHQQVYPPKPPPPPRIKPRPATTSTTNGAPPDSS